MKLNKFSKREIDILKQIAKGFTSEKVAENLGISIYTVDTHKKNILKKSSAKNMIELIVLCVKNELI